MIKMIIKPIIKAVMPWGISQLKNSRGVFVIIRTFIIGGSVVDILRELVKLTAWEWDDKMIDMPASQLIRDAIDNIDGEKNAGVEWYDFFISALKKTS